MEADPFAGLAVFPDAKLDADSVAAERVEFFEPNVGICDSAESGIYSLPPVYPRQIVESGAKKGADPV
jgi:hypothetical protein